MNTNVSKTFRRIIDAMTLDNFKWMAKTITVMNNENDYSLAVSPTNVLTHEVVNTTIITKS